MQIVKLTKGYQTVVDDSEMFWVGRHKWKALTLKGGVYAARSGWDRSIGKHTTIFLHREIMHAEGQQEVDHRDGNKLNNLKSNLRYCSHAENSYNTHARKNNTTGVQGVYWHVRNKKWLARIKCAAVSPKVIHLGSFQEKKDAIAARDAAVREYFGEFGVLSRDQTNRDSGTSVSTVPPQNR